MPTPRHSLPIRRRVVFINGVENRAPGRVAYVVHRGRRRSRLGAASTYQMIADLIRRRQDQLAAEDLTTSTPPASENESGSTPDESPPTDPVWSPTDEDDAGRDEKPDRGDRPSSEHDAVDRPTDEWTKGRLYELARSYDLEGRSKLNKSDLLEAVQQEWDRHHEQA